jgi:hypothetical protein
MSGQRLFPVLASLMLLAGAPAGSQELVRPLARPAAVALPDLVVDDIRLDRQCRLVVQIRNDGPGRVPESVWTRHHPRSAGIQVTRDGVSWGGATIWRIDPDRGLQPRGGKATYLSSLRVDTAASITAEVDRWNEVRETNEGNNRRSERLICRRDERGDLSVQISACPARIPAGTALDGRLKVQARSTFPGPLGAVPLDLVLTASPTYPVPAPYAAYSPTYSDGVLLQGGREHLDFAGPGLLGVALHGVNRIPADTPAGTYYIGAVIDAGNQVEESDESNNLGVCRIQVTRP